jgi:hypothetical protein
MGDRSGVAARQHADAASPRDKTRRRRKTPAHEDGAFA